MSEFKREQRYAVLKLKDVNEALNKNEIYTLNILSHKVAKHREAIGKPPLECVCPESDWPIYEEVWDMVQRLAEGREQKTKQLQKENTYLREEVENYRSTLSEGANLICESLGVEPEFYDRDQSDYACYSDMFEDAAKVILQSGIRWDVDEGEFKESEGE